MRERRGEIREVERVGLDKEKICRKGGTGAKQQLRILFKPCLNAAMEMVSRKVIMGSMRTRFDNFGTW